MIIIYRFLSVITAGLVLFSLTQPAGAASFDCSKAATPFEKTVCDSPSLSPLDEELAEAYKKARSASTDPVKLKAEQLEWIKEARKCQSDRYCIERSYNKRLSELDPQPVKVTQENQAPASPAIATSPEALASSAVLPASAAEVESTAVPASAVSQAEAPVPAASEPLTENAGSITSVFSNETYQRYALIAVGTIFGVIALFYLLRFFISMAKKGAEKATSAARDGYVKAAEEAAKLKHDLGNKAEELSLQAKERANAAADEFGKDGGLKDQIKAVSLKAVETIKSLGTNSNENGAVIVNKKPLYKRWWFWLLGLLALGQVGLWLEDPKIKECKEYAFRYYYNQKKFEEEIHKYDTDGGAQLKSNLLRLEDNYESQRDGCKYAK